MDLCAHRLPISESESPNGIQMRASGIPSKPARLLGNVICDLKIRALPTSPDLRPERRVYSSQGRNKPYFFEESRGKLSTPEQGISF